jgi:hypothetical protein
MGLEFGSPWLVAVVNEGTDLRLLHKDNFTGAGFERVRRAVREVPGAFAAALGKDESLATHPDGTLFDPIAETKGRSFGTSSEKGHRAYLIACELLNERELPLTSYASTVRFFRPITYLIYGVSLFSLWTAAKKILFDQ